MSQDNRVHLDPQGLRGNQAYPESVVHPLWATLDHPVHPVRKEKLDQEDPLVKRVG